MSHDILDSVPSLAEVMPLAQVELLRVDGDDETFVRRARTSFDNESAEVKSYGLIDYLVRHWHTSPMEMCSMTFGIIAPLFVVQQLLRHRTGKYSQASARYIELEHGVHTPTSWRVRAGNVKQGSTELAQPDPAWQQACAIAYNEAMQACALAYDRLIALGVAPEQARMCQPVAQMTRLVAQFDVHNLMHYLRLRLDEHTQKEHRALAREMAVHFAQAFPHAWEAFTEHRHGAVTFSAREMELLRAGRTTYEDASNELGSASRAREFIGKLRR